MTTEVAASTSPPLPASRLSARAWMVVRTMARRGLHFRLRCLVMGHEDTLGREPRRLLLKCAACGRETVGWAIGPGTPELTAPRASIGVRTATPTSAPRSGRWLGRWHARAEARDRQRQRLAAAAARAAEPRAEERPSPPARDSRAKGRLLAADRQPDRWLDAARHVRAALGG